MTAEPRPEPESPASVSLSELELEEGWHGGDESARWRAGFPLTPGMLGSTDVAADDLAVVVIELEPGNRLGTHTDSAEELLFVVDGAVEAMVGESRVDLASGELAVVPSDVPHGIRNVGDVTARVLGFFGESEVTATFEAEVSPFETSVFEIRAERGA